jgi:hypothetical protein
MAYDVVRGLGGNQFPIYGGGGSSAGEHYFHFPLLFGLFMSYTCVFLFKGAL